VLPRYSLRQHGFRCSRVITPAQQRAGWTCGAATTARR
jgi:hypothetical protein